MTLPDVEIAAPVEAVVLEVEAPAAAALVEVITVGPTPGPPGPPGPPGGAFVDGRWDYAIQTSPPPAVGTIRTTPATIAVGVPMTIWLSATDDEGFAYLNPQIVPGDQIMLRGSAGAVQIATITSFNVTVPGATGFATIVAMPTSVDGQIAKQAVVEVSLIRQAGQWKQLTQAEYDALNPPDPNTLYVIVG